MSVSNHHRKRRRGLKINNVSFQGDNTGSEKRESSDHMNRAETEEQRKVSVFTAIDSATMGSIDHLLFLLF